MKFKAFLLTALLAFGLNVVRAQSGISANLNSYFTALTNIKQFNGCVLVAAGDHVLLQKTYNMPGQEPGLRITANSRFIIASVSKVFIKYSILKLVALKRLQLDDPLSRFVPDFPDGKKITVQELMDHTSGLPRELTGYEAYESLKLEQIVDLAKKEKLQSEPGTQFLYSNVGFFLLDYIIRKSSTEGYPAFTDGRVLKPMGLLHTAEFNTINNVPLFAYGYGKTEKGILPVDKKNINQFETGNYVSTLSDLYLFSREMLSGNILPRELALKMFKGDTVLQQAGGRPGYRAYFYKNLKSGLTFIFVSNYSDIPIEKIIAVVPAIAAGKTFDVPHITDRKEISLDTALLKRYAGTYRLDADQSQVFTVTVANGKLVLTDQAGSTVMIADTETSFFEKPDSEDGIVFIPSGQSAKYQMVFKSNGLTLKTTRIQ
jgi:CubicO group peptidase (beta-lactamase class C family)